jgi:hypothetical protein
LNENFQIEQNTLESTTKGNEKITIQTNLAKLHAQRKTWRNHNMNVIC